MKGQLSAVATAERLSRAECWLDAADRWQAVVEVNPVNGVYWNRLGQARFALGDYRGALAAYEKALSLGVWPVRGPDPVPLTDVLPGEISYLVACCHARLGDTGPALDALAEAVRCNLRDLDRATTDEHLASLRGEARFRELVAPAGTAERPGVDGRRGDGTRGDGTLVDGSRVDGWRADLHAVCREVRRRVPFKDVVDAGFEQAAAELEREIPELPDIRIAVGLWGLLRRLGDGHARVLADPAYPDWGRCLPVWFFLFAEGLFVTDADPRYARLAGAQVLAFDGRPVSEAVAALDPLLTRDNEYGPPAIAPAWLRQPAYLHAVGVADDPGRVTLTVRLEDGSTAEVTVAAEPAQRPRGWPHSRPPASARPAGQAPAYLRAVHTPYWFEYLPGADLVYFQFNAIGDMPEEPLTAFSERLFAAVDHHRAAALVIDLRWNGGGNTFLAMPLVDRVIRHDRINRRGALFVITGRDTFSAAQNTATLLDRHTHALFVGEPSGSSPNFVGETVPFTLPHSGLRVNVSDLYWQTSWPLDHRRAIAPDIYAPPTFAAYRAGRDVAMEAILESLDASPGGRTPPAPRTPDGINEPDGVFDRT